MHILRPSTALLFLFVAGFSAFANAEFETVGVVRELDEVEIPSRRDGVIAEITVRRGARVSAKQLISRLDPTEITLQKQVTEAELEQATVKAANLGPVRTAEAAVKRAKQELVLLNELGENAVYLERFRMRNNTEKAAAELLSAKNDVEHDRMQANVKKKELLVRENELSETRIVSPVNGTVQEVLKDEGEWVRQGDGILRVTRMDRLIVEGFLNSAQIAAHKVEGAPARIIVQVDGEQTFELDGLLVRHAASKLELDGKFPIWVEFKNQLITTTSGEETWLIRPGMRAKMVISLPAATPSTTESARTKMAPTSASIRPLAPPTVMNES